MAKVREEYEDLFEVLGFLVAFVIGIVIIGFISAGALYLLGVR
tara:strand:+ start:1706 stop:1834 length:129 start_codon:yes stop_codon:yes gene_type:complete